MESKSINDWQSICNGILKMATELKTDIISPSTTNQVEIEVAEEQMIVIDADGNVQVATAWNPSLSTTGKAFVMGF